MKVTSAGIARHLETEAGPAALAEALTRLGLEVEAVEDPSARLAAFVVGHILEADKHPNADRLKLCRVDVGAGAPVQVVCGAPNARAGLKTAFAAPGTLIPATGTVLKVGAIRGVESRGMLCSARELALELARGEDQEGILELPAAAIAGEALPKALGMAEGAVIEIGLTPNRVDAAGARGMARDLAAAGIGRLKPLDISPVAGAYPCPVAVTLAFPGPQDLPGAPGPACAHFIARVIRGVRNGPSPAWLQAELKALGLRPISALVDITNFLTLDLNRPLHVFDRAKIGGDRLTVRPARAGETLAALGNRALTLPEGAALIVDAADRPLSLGGIIGGAASGADETTTDIVLEAAWFEPLAIALAGRAVGVDSDARFRFERGVDPASTAWGIEVATRLILELCGGAPSDLFVAGAAIDRRQPLRFRPARVASLGGLTLPPAQQRTILEALGFTVTTGADGAIGADGAAWTVTAPTWRLDIEGEADLVEEVVRVAGLEALPSAPLPKPERTPPPALTPAQKMAGLVRRLLAMRGLTEAVTWSFMDEALAERFGSEDAGLSLQNPIAEPLKRMRPTPLPHLLEALARNAARGLGDDPRYDLALFEVGPGFRKAVPGAQETVAVAARAGTGGPRHWAVAARALDLYDAKADALAVLAAAGAPIANLQVSADAPSWYHPGRSGCFRLGPSVLAQFGEVHPELARRLDLKGGAIACEVFLDRLPPPKKGKGSARPALKLAALQPVSRDFAFLVGADVPAAKLVDAARKADKQLIVDVRLFDRFAGEGVPAGQVSLAFAVTLQPQEKTLTDAEIEAVAARIVAEVQKATGATLRG